MHRESELINLNSFLTSKVPPLIDPMEYCTPTGAINLIVAPFVQGLFQGLGDGLAKVLVGKWVILIDF